MNIELFKLCSKENQIKQLIQFNLDEYKDTRRIIYKNFSNTLSFEFDCHYCIESTNSSINAMNLLSQFITDVCFYTLTDDVLQFPIICDSPLITYLIKDRLSFNYCCSSSEDESPNGYCEVSEDEPLSNGDYYTTDGKLYKSINDEFVSNEYRVKNGKVMPW